MGDAPLMPRPLFLDVRRTCVRRLVLYGIVFWCSVVNTPLMAGQEGETFDTTGASDLMTPPGYVGPPVPIPPEVVARDDTGVTIRAVRIDRRIRVDGLLDDLNYGASRFTSGFIQTEPSNGQPASQDTDVWLFFDDTNVYVGLRVWERDLDRMVATEMRHDAAASLIQNELITVVFDTFYDRRNGYAFYGNPLGGRGEGQVANESQYNGDWNGIWESAVGRFEGGWTFEMAVPFKTLRHRSDEHQVWGFQVRRNNRWKNEISFLAPSDPALGLGGGFMAASLYATVVGITAPPPALNLDVKPYVVSDLTTNDMASPPLRNHADADLGLDVKYGVSESLVADFTYNTDFAQVEADEQQVNLTRFSLFFPEKREFFLENQGTFAFGGAGAGPFGGGGETPVLFYSRRIGLSGSREVPIQAGGRLSGRVGEFTLGVLDVRSDDEPVSGALATNFTVARLKRDVLRRSAVGLLFTNRSVAENGVGSNQTYGVDGTFAFFTTLSINAYWARTRTSGFADGDVSYRGQLNYNGDRYGAQVEHLLVGDNFNPEVGFLRRDDMRKSYAQVRFSPRPTQPSIVRKYTWVGSGTYIEDTRGRVETREARAEFGIEFQSSDQISVSYTGAYEFLPQPFRIAPDVVLPVGGYDFGFLNVGMNFGQHRPLYGSVSVEHGTLFDGDRTTFSLRQGRLNVTPRFSLEPSLSINHVDLPAGSFTATLIGSRVTYTMTPLMFVSSLVQYSSSSETIGANVRLRWEYLPGSELFVVYNEQRDTLARSFPELTNRVLVIKVNRLFRF